jgi:hypothetical protein
LICTVGGVANFGSISVKDYISKLIFWYNCYHYVLHVYPLSAAQLM